MTSKRTEARLLIALVTLPAGPSRHRVAVGREQRKVGALSLRQGTWAGPRVPAFTTGLDRTAELVQRAEGEIIFLHASGDGDGARSEAMARDVFGACDSDDATARLQHCTRRFENYAERVIASLHATDSEHP